MVNNESTSLQAAVTETCVNLQFHGDKCTNMMKYTHRVLIVLWLQFTSVAILANGLNEPKRMGSKGQRMMGEHLIFGKFWIADAKLIDVNMCQCLFQNALRNVLMLPAEKWLTVRNALRSERKKIFWKLLHIHPFATTHLLPILPFLPSGHMWPCACPYWGHTYSVLNSPNECRSQLSYHSIYILLWPTNCSSRSRNRYHPPDWGCWSPPSAHTCKRRSNDDETSTTEPLKGNCRLKWQI